MLDGQYQTAWLDNDKSANYWRWKHGDSSTDNIGQITASENWWIEWWTDAIGSVTRSSCPSYRNNYFKVSMHGNWWLVSPDLHSSARKLHDLCQRHLTVRCHGNGWGHKQLKQFWHPGSCHLLWFYENCSQPLWLSYYRQHWWDYFEW